MDLQGKPVLQRIIERCRAAVVDDVIVATTTKDRDIPIVEFCKKLRVNYFRGSESKPLDRVYFAANTFDVDLIVDVTGDCPLVDPVIINQLVEIFDIASNTEYASNIIERSFPDGFDCQSYTFQALKRVYELSEDNRPISKQLKQYVGWNFTQLDSFFKQSITPPEKYQLPKWRLTLDTPKDYELISWLYSVMGDEIWGHKRIIDFLESNIADFISYDSMTEQTDINSIYKR
jgi:spore coat polysaccharide biosynthesis protein SpsF